MKLINVLSFGYLSETVYSGLFSLKIANLYGLHKGLSDSPSLLFSAK